MKLCPISNHYLSLQRKEKPQHMKKLLVLFLGLTLITSCSNDDDVTTPDQDPIVGTWILADATFFDPASCEEDSTITFTADNKANGTFYFDQTDCSAESSAGEWINNGNSLYTVAVPVIGNVQGTVNFSNEDRFVFTTTTFGAFTFERQ